MKTSDDDSICHDAINCSLLVSYTCYDNSHWLSNYTDYCNGIVEYRNRDSLVPMGCPILCMGN